ncbi:hypothetical protein F966_02804 [Acinetobacter higginsii]|uniref:Knr4/Smi1-like domain-containing protein n=1 Tax=Acinetobacter higginsii TaxID=70347 RepID=N8XI07_9GAMM|nr:SMI1/KNR4 family protein [Acinetobacter higginsii]ENV08689.1 hypothetical protein F966_02804 [Acinetobacter higginsii]
MAFPVDEQYIIAAEQEFGRLFPSDHRKRLLQSNGGEIQADDEVWQLFPVFDPTNQKRIARTTNHIVHETALWRSSYGFPEDAIAIAENGAGDVLIIKNDSDLIEHWSHETGTLKTVEVDWG